MKRVSGSAASTSDKEVESSSVNEQERNESEYTDEVKSSEGLREWDVR